MEEHYHVRCDRSSNLIDMGYVILNSVSNCASPAYLWSLLVVKCGMKLFLARRCAIRTFDQGTRMRHPWNRPWGVIWDCFRTILRRHRKENNKSGRLCTDQRRLGVTLQLGCTCKRIYLDQLLWIPYLPSSDLISWYTSGEHYSKANRGFYSASKTFLLIHEDSWLVVSQYRSHFRVKYHYKRHSYNLLASNIVHHRLPLILINVLRLN